MSKIMKIILIAVAAVILAAAVGTGIYFIARSGDDGGDPSDGKYELDGMDGEYSKLY